MKTKTLALALAITLAASAASAQTSATTVVGTNVDQVLTVSVDRTTAEFGNVQKSHLDIGNVWLPAPIIVSHSGNVAHHLHVSSGGAATMTAASIDPDGGTTGRQDKPVSDVTWSLAPVSAGGIPNLLHADNRIVRSSPAGNFTGDAAVKLYLRLALSYTADTPGRYTVPLVFTVTPQ